MGLSGMRKTGSSDDMYASDVDGGGDDEPADDSLDIVEAGNANADAEGKGGGDDASSEETFLEEGPEGNANKSVVKSPVHSMTQDERSLLRAKKMFMFARCLLELINNSEELIFKPVREREAREARERGEASVPDTAAASTTNTSNNKGDGAAAPTLNMRVGMHMGSFVGGVIGTTKLRFDIWGFDVLIANQVESNGIPGRVVVTEKLKNILAPGMRDSTVQNSSSVQNLNMGNKRSPGRLEVPGSSGNDGERINETAARQSRVTPSHAHARFHKEIEVEGLRLKTYCLT